MIVKSESDVMMAVHLKQTFPAPRDKVFRAWTDPDALKRWWGPPGSTIQEVKVDLRVGGAYRIGIQYPPDDVFYLNGTYREVQPPEKLVFTWRWEKPDMDFGESVVTLEFHELGDSTVVTLTHEGFPNRDVAESHNEGWAAILDSLSPYLDGDEG